MEIWKDIKGFEGKYQISDLGNIKSLPRLKESKTKDGNRYYSKIKGGLLSPVNNGIGYYQIGLNSNGKCLKKYVHRLVYETFIDEIPNSMEINHIDHDKFNNKLSNLEIVTHKTNTKLRNKFYDNCKKEFISCDCCGTDKRNNGSTTCKDCSRINSRKVERPSKECLSELLRTTSFVKVGKKYGVSDNTIRKWIKNLI